MIISNPNGTYVDVNDENMMMVRSVESTVEHHTNHTEGDAYHLLFSATPTASGDCFLYVKNTNDENMIVEGYSLWLAANEYIDIKFGDVGTPVGGDTIVPTNCNAGSTKSSDGTYENGNDITGLSGGTTVERLYHASSQESTYWNEDMDLIVPQNQVLTMYAQTGGTALAGVLSFYLHN